MNLKHFKYAERKKIQAICEIFNTWGGWKFNVGDTWMNMAQLKNIDQVGFCFNCYFQSLNDFVDTLLNRKRDLLKQVCNFHTSCEKNAKDICLSCCIRERESEREREREREREWEREREREGERERERECVCFCLKRDEDHKCHRRLDTNETSSFAKIEKK